MGFYRDQVLPRVLNTVMNNREMRGIRRRVCAGLRGEVIEVGFGSGLNVPEYPSEVDGVWVIEPSDVAMELGAKRINASPIPIHRVGTDGQRLDLPDDRFDCALSTWTLCTIPDVGAALRELQRVLKPGGVFHFAEHGRAPDPKVARAQDRFDPINTKIAGGCHLTRRIPRLIEEAGFHIEELDTFFLRGPKIVSYTFVGRARAA